MSAQPQQEFNCQVGNIYITAVNYLWTSMANTEGTIVPEAGLRDMSTGDFTLCQHGMNHKRAVDMLIHCLEHGLNMYEAAEHVASVGGRYADRWGGGDEDHDWKRPVAKVL